MRLNGAWQETAGSCVNQLIRSSETEGGGGQQRQQLSHRRGRRIFSTYFIRIILYNNTSPGPSDLDATHSTQKRNNKNKNNGGY